MIFTDDECRRIYNDAMELPGRTTLVVMRAIEAAILAKLRKGVEVLEGDVRTESGTGKVLRRDHSTKQLLAYGAAQRLAGREQDKADAERYRWLTDDHADAEMRDRAEDIGIRLRWICKGAADATIDAAMLAASPQEQI